MRYTANRRRKWSRIGIIKIKTIRKDFIIGPEACDDLITAFEMLLLPMSLINLGTSLGMVDQEILIDPKNS